MANASEQYVEPTVTKNLHGLDYSDPLVAKNYPTPIKQPTATAATFRWDWPLRDPSKAIEDYIYDAAGDEVPGATVVLVRQADDQVVATTTSDGTGYYSFMRDADDPHIYYVMAYLAGAPQTHGTSDRGLVPA